MLPMGIPRNLISDSALVQEALDLLRGNGGRMTFAEVVDRIFRLANADKRLAASLVSDLIGEDPRFGIEAEHLVATRLENENLPLTHIDFIVFDIEATSERSQPSRIIELGAYRVRDNQIGESLQTLANPGRPLSEFVSALTGVSDQMLRAAPLFGEVARAWLDFAGDAVLVAHSSTFDLALLNREIARVFPGYRMGNDELCTVNLARSVFPDLTSYRLESLARHFGFEMTEPHRGLSDALTTAHVLLRLLTELNGRGARTLSDVHHPETEGKTLRNLRLAVDV